MPFQYNRVLVIGATSGIGEALAARLVEEGSNVIVVGRRKDKLEDFVHRHGKDKTSAVPFDITEHEKIPNFVTKYVVLRAPEASMILTTPLSSASPKPTLTLTASS